MEKATFEPYISPETRVTIFANRFIFIFVLRSEKHLIVK